MPSISGVSTQMGVAFSLLVIAFLLYWIAFVKKPTKSSRS